MVLVLEISVVMFSEVKHFLDFVYSVDFVVAVVCGPDRVVDAACAYDLGASKSSPILI